MNATAQLPTPPQSSALLRNFPQLPPLCLPIGLDALYAHFLKYYPTQKNPTQMSTAQKLWLGGTDPLDYVNVYFNTGDRANRIPPHWHYVSLGLSDLHGDGRVHQRRAQNQPSGYGYELTFRLKFEPSTTTTTQSPATSTILDPTTNQRHNQNRPPSWPAILMQRLARYAFRGSKLSIGDFVKLDDSPLDGTNESRIQHILLVNDARFSPLVASPLGRVDFVQIVGICEEERRAVQKWTALGVAEQLRKHAATGGSWLITDLRRGESLFDVDPCAKDIVDLGVASEGSNLTGIQAWCAWSEWTDYVDEEETPSGSNYGPTGAGVGADWWTPAITDDQSTPSSSQKQPSQSDHDSRLDSYRRQIYDVVSSIYANQREERSPLATIHLRLNAAAASYLPIALRGRLAHGRHFTFKSQHGDFGDITLVPPGTGGSMTTSEEPYASRRGWLHAQLYPELQESMLNELAYLETIDPSTIREERHYRWPYYKLKLTIIPEPAF